MTTKKILYRASVLTLMGGASLILGLLSFGGMFVLWPILPLAIGALGLSIAYEGEIYLQNIKLALNKLFFKPNFFQNKMAKDFLLEHFPKNTDDEDCPQFFRDYKLQIQLLEQFKQKPLTKEGRRKKKLVEKELKKMEEWFASRLFSHQLETEITAYDSAIRKWFLDNEHTISCIEKHTLHQKYYHWTKAFSVLSGLFMMLGTSYLLVETFQVIPLLAGLSFSLLPFFIVPMAVIAGTAYMFLIYNAVTEMIHNDTLRNWYDKIRNSFSHGLSGQSVTLAIAAIVLLSLAVALTLCTAGTWWTVVKHTRPLFSWMSKFPSFIMGVIHPLITGISSLIFNLQNTSESLKLIEETLKHASGFFTRLGLGIIESLGHLIKRENWFQVFNPFRIILKLTITPLRILFFFGHLISIGVTADRMPGVSEILSALLGIISEGFEDLHYFVGHNEHDHHGEKKEFNDLLTDRLSSKHSHSHSVDIPTRLLKLIFTPLYYLSACWDCVFSKRNEGTPRDTLNLKQARKKSQGKFYGQKNDVNLDGVQKPSTAWTIQQLDYEIECFKEKHNKPALIKKRIVQNKCNELSKMQAAIKLGQPINEVLTEAANCNVFAIHRFFNSEKKTKTELFIADLKTRFANPG